LRGVRLGVYSHNLKYYLEVMGGGPSKPPLAAIEPPPPSVPPEETPKPTAFSMDDDTYDAFRTKDKDGIYPYKRFETDLNDAKTLEYKIPELIESYQKKTQKDLAYIETNARRDIEKRNAKYRKDISNKEDNNESQLEPLREEIYEIIRLLKEEKMRSNDVETPEVISINERLSQAKLNFKKKQIKLSIEMNEITSLFESDISVITDLKRDDIRKTKNSRAIYKKKLIDKLKSAVDDINNKYPTELLKMSPKLEVDEGKDECTIVLPQDILDFIKNKTITYQPKPVLNRKFGFRFEDEEEDDDVITKEVERMQRLTDLLEKRYAEGAERREAEAAAELERKNKQAADEVERKNREEEQKAFDAMFNTDMQI
jgi:hypothetical protein